jgi:hypothetical protein
MEKVSLSKTQIRKLWSAWGKKKGFKMTPLEHAIREATEQWIASIVGCETEFLSIVEDRITEGEGLDTVAEDFMSEYVDFDMLIASVEDAINDSLDELNIEVNVDWNKEY